MLLCGGVNIFTDGSKDGFRTGAAVVIRDGGQTCIDDEGNERSYQYHLGCNTTVFQTEMFALKMAATLIINGSHGDDDWVEGRPITINCDSQAAILDLTKLLNNPWGRIHFDDLPRCRMEIGAMEEEELQDA